MTHTAVAALPARRRASAWVHMPGLDGVRAVAVLAVVVFHMDEAWLPGGFLGVDVFFTLSGFLITSLLLAELEATDRIGFKNFYLRRARRLLPALYLVLVATAILAVTVAQDAAERVREDAIAAFFYVTNWWYVLHGTSYFEATGRPPMLQHLWSLAVEEQFYFVWPLLVLGLWRLGQVRGIRIGAVAGALLSTALMVWIAAGQGMPTAADPSRVYFGSDTHAMTLLVGAALATVWVPAKLALTSRGVRLMTVLGSVSLVALIAIFWFVGPDSTFLYRGGFLVVGIVTAGVVAAAAVTQSAFAGALGRQPWRWIGERSYGIYLWHWPVFMVLRPGIDLDQDGPIVQVLRLSVTLALAELSYRFVEMPIRHGAIGRAWKAWKEQGGWAFVGRAATAAVMSVAVVLSLGFGLGHAQEPTLEDALGGVTGVGDEDLTPLTPTPTPSGSGVAPSGKPTSKPTPPPGPPVLAAGVTAVGLPTTAVGDSVMLAARQALQDALPKTKVDAEVSRQSGAVFSRIKQRAKAGKLGDVVVIHTGTNGVIVKSQLVDILRFLEDRSRVVLVTVKADRSWVDNNNRIITSVAEQFAGTNVRVADWAAYSKGNRDWFYADGIHTKGEGSAKYAALIKKTLSE